MPYLYNFQAKEQAENFTTSGSGNTEIDFGTLIPGATRVASLLSFRVGGKGNQLTSLTGIAFRIKQWTTSSSTGGTGATLSPVDKRSPAAVTLCRLATSGGNAAVTSGAGGPVYVGNTSCGASGPGGWVAINPDAAINLDGGANSSTDFFSSAPTASMNFEFGGETQE